MISPCGRRLNRPRCELLLGLASDASHFFWLNFLAACSKSIQKNACHQSIISWLITVNKFVETAHWLLLQAVPAQARLTLSRQQSLAWTHFPTPAALSRLSNSGYAECPLTAARQGHLVWQPVSHYLRQANCECRRERIVKTDSCL